VLSSTLVVRFSFISDFRNSKCLTSSVRMIAQIWLTLSLDRYNPKHKTFQIIFTCHIKTLFQIKNKNYSQDTLTNILESFPKHNQCGKYRGFNLECQLIYIFVPKYAMKRIYMSCKYVSFVLFFTWFIFFSGICEDIVQENLLKLLAARYVERCPTHEPVLAAKVKDETTAKKRGAKSAKVIVDSCQIYLLMIVCCTELGMAVDYLCVCMRMCMFNL
jgi:hypothetical protein